MSASERQMKQAALAQILAQSAAGIGSGGPMGDWAARQAGVAANMAQAEAMKQFQEEQEKKEKSAKLGKLGAIIGSVGLPFLLPGIGMVPAAALGGTLGSAGGQAAGGGGIDFGNVIQSGVVGGAGALAGGALFGGVGSAAAGAGMGSAVGNTVGSTAAKVGTDTVLKAAPGVAAATGAPALVQSAGGVGGNIAANALNAPVAAVGTDTVLKAASPAVTAAPAASTAQAVSPIVPSASTEFAPGLKTSGYAAQPPAYKGIQLQATQQPTGAFNQILPQLAGTSIVNGMIGTDQQQYQRPYYRYGF